MAFKDKELMAMRRIKQVLSDLSPSQQRRVITWAVDAVQDPEEEGKELDLSTPAAKTNPTNFASQPQ